MAPQNQMGMRGGDFQGNRPMPGYGHMGGHMGRPPIAYPGGNPGGPLQGGRPVPPMPMNPGAPSPFFGGQPTQLGYPTAVPGGLSSFFGQTPSPTSLISNTNYNPLTSGGNWGNLLTGPQNPSAGFGFNSGQPMGGAGGGTAPGAQSPFFGGQPMQPLTGGYGSNPTGLTVNTNYDPLNAPVTPSMYQSMPTTQSGNMAALQNSMPRNTGGRVQRATGGRTKSKGKTNIVINVSPQGSQPPAMPMPPMPPMGGMPPMPPGGAPPMPPGADGPPMPPGAGGPPPQLAQALAALQGGPSPMARKSGGRVHQETEFGSGSGLGRLEKPKWYK